MRVSMGHGIRASAVVMLLALVSSLSALAASSAGEGHARSERALGDDGEWFEIPLPPPSPRLHHTAIYDSVRDRMVVFGGAGNPGEADVWTLPLTGPPQWHRLVPATSSPITARAGHTAIHDRIRDRMVVFGGRQNDGTITNEVWTLSLSGTPTWSVLVPTGTPPPARHGHSAIYDRARDRMVVFGGSTTTGYLNDVWVLSMSGTPAWTLLTTGAPPSRVYHTAIHDPVRDRMIVHGGFGGSSQSLSDVWVMSLAGDHSWTNVTPPVSPGSRYGHTANYDPVNDCMWVFGGSHGNSVWALSISGSPSWTDLTPAGPHPAAGTIPFWRTGHTSIYDAERHRLVIFGGVGHDHLNDLWELSLTGSPTWGLISGAPVVRQSHSAVYDPIRERMIVFSGGSANPAQNDVWALSLFGPPVWTRLLPSGSAPTPRVGHTAIYDPIRDRMVIFGGRAEYPTSQVVNDVWALTLSASPAWIDITPSGPAPAPRMLQSAIYDPVRDCMVVFGGLGGPTAYNDVWLLSLAGTPAWTQLDPAGTIPNPNSGPNAIYDPASDRMVVVAPTSLGYGVWELSLASTPTWSSLPFAPTIGPALYDPVRDRMVVFGGSVVGALKLSGTPAWTTLHPAGSAPPSRAGHTVIYDHARDRMVMFSGTGSVSPYYYRDTWALAWTPPTAVDSPEVPMRLELARPRPNPFRASLKIDFMVERSAPVLLEIHDVTGRRVRRLANGLVRPGHHSRTWDGRTDAGDIAPHGVYFVRLSSFEITTSRRAVLIH